MADRLPPPRPIGDPRPGYFRMRLVRGGPWVGALIYRPCPLVPSQPGLDPAEWGRFYDRPQPLCALVDGRAADPLVVWTVGREIGRAEYLYLTEAAVWDRAWRPDAPAANPTRAVDLDRLPPIF